MILNNIQYIYLFLFYVLIVILYMKYVHFNIKRLKVYEVILNPIEIDKGVYIFSGILDKNVVRLISFHMSEENHFKNIKLLSINSSSIVNIIQYKGVHNKYFNILCKKSNYITNSNSIIISNKEIKLFNNYKLKSKYNLLFCLTTLFSYNNTNRFIEFVEYYKNFGVDKFIVYNTNCSKQIEKIFIYYNSIGLMDIIFDNFTHNLDEKKRFHVWKQNDCFHRYKYYAKRIIFTDHDEIIYSPKYNNSVDLFSHLNNNASFYHFYPKLTITNGKGFFHRGYYSICPNTPWKFIINKCSCILQVVVHDVILKNKRNCIKETVLIENGYVIHARNKQSRHSKVCKKWNNNSNYDKEKRILHNQKELIKVIIFNSYE